MEAAHAARTRLPVVLALCLIPIAAHMFIVLTAHCRLGFTFGFESLFKLGFVTASAITHWGIYISLLVTFGLTLRPGHEALITTMARKRHGESRNIHGEGRNIHGDCHGDIPPQLAEYTRRVTLAWCCFFAVQLSLSVTLFCFAPLVVWSFFVNILDIPLVALMFAAEYFVRLRCLDDPPRHSLPVIIKMIGEAAGNRAPGDRKSAMPVNAAQPD
jgi:uncharacterized membrane protein